MKDQVDSTTGSFFGKMADLARRPDRPSRGLGNWIRNRLIAGLLVAFPLAVTILFGRFLFQALDRWFRPISERLFGFQIFGVGFVLTILGLLILGAVAMNVVGSRMLGFFEKRISQLPLISPIYKGARQITEAIQFRDVTEFRRVVMLGFPHPSVRSVGFVTREFPRATQFSEEGSALVFVPTTPNPTSGFLVSVPLAELTALDISVEEGIKFVISGGLLTPPKLLFPDDENSNKMRDGEP